MLRCNVELQVRSNLCLLAGTHWLAEVIERIPNAGITLTSPVELGDISKFEELRMVPKRRVIPTHLNYEMLPVTVKQKQCKVGAVPRGSLRNAQFFSPKDSFPFHLMCKRE